METITKAAQSYTPPATVILHQTEASLTERPFGVPIHIVQYDTGLPVLEVSLYSHGQPHTVPAGAAVNVRMDKLDGHYVYNPALGLDNTRTIAYVAITQQMTTGSGHFEPILEIVVDDGVVGTASFALEIDRNPVPEDAVESSDEYKTVQQLIADAEAAASAAASSATAAASSATKAQTAQSGAEIAANAAGAAQTGAENALDTIATLAEAAATSAEASANSATDATTQATTAAQKATDAAASATAAQEYARQAQQVSQGAVGYYETDTALKTAHPTAEAGNWAIIGSTDTIWVWDTDTNAWIDSLQNVNMSDYYTKDQTDQKITDGNVASATKLATARKINGTDFDGTKSIDTSYSYNYVLPWSGSGNHIYMAFLKIKRKTSGSAFLQLLVSGNTSNTNDGNTVPATFLSVYIRDLADVSSTCHLTASSICTNYPPRFGYWLEDEWLYVGTLKYPWSLNTHITVLGCDSDRYSSDEINYIAETLGTTKPTGWTDIPLRVLQDASQVAASRVDGSYGVYQHSRLTTSINTFCGGSGSARYNTVTGGDAGSPFTGGTSTNYSVIRMDWDHSTTWAKQLAFRTNDKNAIAYRSKQDDEWRPWSHVAFAVDEANTDTVAKAQKLYTPRTINGRAFDGSANIRGTSSYNFYLGNKGTTTKVWVDIVTYPLDLGTAGKSDNINGSFILSQLYYALGASQPLLFVTFSTNRSTPIISVYSLGGDYSNFSVGYYIVSGVVHLAVAVQNTFRGYCSITALSPVDHCTYAEPYTEKTTQPTGWTDVYLNSIFTNVRNTTNNLNNITTPGVYYTPSNMSLINSKYSGDTILEVFGTNGLLYQRQIGYSNTTQAPYTAERVRYPGTTTWTPWRKIYNEKQPPTAAEVGAVPVPSSLSNFSARVTVMCEGSASTKNLRGTLSTIPGYAPTVISAAYTNNSNVMSNLTSSQIQTIHDTMVVSADGNIYINFSSTDTGLTQGKMYHLLMMYSLYKYY